MAALVTVEHHSDWFTASFPRLFQRFEGIGIASGNITTGRATPPFSLRLFLFVPGVRVNNVTVFIQMGDFLIAQGNFFHVSCTRHRSGIVHNRVMAHHLHIFQRDRVVDFLLSTLVNSVEIEFSAFKRLPCSYGFEKVRR